MTQIATCTAGDQVTLPPITLELSEGYSLDGAILRLRIWAGPLARPSWEISLEYDSESAELVDGVLTPVLRALDWPPPARNAFAISTAQLELEVTLDDATHPGPYTVLRNREIRVLPQAIR
jgi:hypothetical protein